MIGILADPVLVERHHLVGAAVLVLRLLELVVLAGVVPELAGGDVERDVDVLAGLVSCLHDGFEETMLSEQYATEPVRQT